MTDAMPDDVAEPEFRSEPKLGEDPLQRSKTVGKVNVLGTYGIAGGNQGPSQEDERNTEPCNEI